MNIIHDLSETVMLVHKCSRRQAVEFLHSSVPEQQFFTDVQLTGYVSYPEDEAFHDPNTSVCELCGSIKHTSECGCEDDYEY